MDMYLILQPGARFTNNATPACKIAPPSIDAAVEQLAGLVPTYAVANPFLNLEVDADKWVHYPEKGHHRVTRLTNHINQYNTWRRCAKEVEKQELASGEVYDAVLRIRDNALVLKPFMMRASLFKHARDWYNTSGEQRPHPITNEHIRRLPVIVKKCCSWGGYHDKTMLVPRAHMDGALNGPADEFYMIQKDEKRLSISNPETYIKYVMGKLKVPVYEQGRADDFPITDGRCEDGESFCVVDNRKDCRPKGVDMNQCKLKYYRGAARSAAAKHPDISLKITNV